MPVSIHIVNIANSLRELVREQLTNCTTKVSNSVMIQNVATAIAYAIPLPASALDDLSPEDYYNTYHRHRVTRLIEALNEEFLVDTSAINRVAVQLWIFRYRMVFSPNAIAGILHVMATADGVYPEVVQEGVAEFQASVGRQASTQEQYNETTREIFKAIERQLNAKANGE